MKKILSVLAVAATAAAVSASGAAAQVGFSVGGGLTIPTGEGSDGVNTGFNAQIGADVAAPAFPVSFRLEGAINQFGLESSSNNVRILSGVANAVLNLALPTLSPYIIGGVGMYNSSVTDVDDSSSTDVGINVGAGLNFPLTGMRGVFIEARYHSIFTENRNTNMIPITLGLRL